MKNKKFIFAFLLLILVAGIIYFTKVRVDTDLKPLIGDYHAISDGTEDSDTYVSYWGLHITSNRFDLLDEEAGNPGIEGTIVEVTDHTISINPTEYFEDQPRDWVKDSDGLLVLKYHIDGKELLLECNKSKLIFEKRE